jgi:predicted O-methyltransferase YrrM
LSNEPKVIEQVKEKKFDVIYIDGDHSYQAVIHDIQTYSPMLSENGFLVMDDASNLIPGSVFWKGRPEVSKACEIIYDLGFENVLNVGHNRIFQKIE